MEIKEICKQIYKKHFDFKLMEEDIGTWCLMENNDKMCVPVEYAHNYVVYQNAYFSDVYNSLTDISLVIYNGGMAAGIWPLGIFQDDSGYQITSMTGRGGIISPLLTESGGTVKSKRKLLQKCMDVLEEICSRFNIMTFKIKSILSDGGRISLWMQMFLEKGAVCRGINFECFVDLSLSEQDILSGIRRTNKYEIKKAYRLWNHAIITKCDGRKKVEECFEQFRELHREVSGKITRSERTWNIQKEAVLNTKDFLVMLYNSEYRLIGGALFSTTGSACSYSVGAYRRELYDQPVSHISQWLAIKHMKASGMRRYYIGTRAYAGDWNHPDEKEIAIGFFKEGFATSIYPGVILEYRYGQDPGPLRGSMWFQ